MNRFIVNGVSTALPLLLGALSSYNKSGEFSDNLGRDARVSGIMLANLVIFAGVRMLNERDHKNKLSNLSTEKKRKKEEVRFHQSQALISQLFTALASQHFLSILRHSMSFAADKNPMLAHAINAASLAFAIKAQGLALSNEDVNLGATVYDFACYGLAFFIKSQYVKPLLASVVPAEYQFVTPVLATSASYTMKYVFSNITNISNISATGFLNSMIRGAGNELAYIGVDAYSQDIKSDSLGIDLLNSIRSSALPELLSDIFDKSVDAVLPR